VGARARARDAVAIADAVAAQAPTDARQLALITALDTLGQATRGDGDARAALLVYRRAEEIASRHAGQADDAPADDPWAAALRTVRRDIVTALLDQGERDRALSLLRDDVASQHRQAEAHPDAPLTLSQEAFDQRRIAFASLGRRELDAAGEALDREALLLHRLGSREPANLEWQRSLAINAGQAAQSGRTARVRRRRGTGSPGVSRGAGAFKGGAEPRGHAGRAEPVRNAVPIEQAVALNYVGLGYKFNQQPDEAQSYFDRGKAAMEALQKKPAKPSP
jgi:tetratricopeptide (TPR) repeat protein